MLPARLDRPGGSPLERPEAAPAIGYITLIGVDPTPTPTTACARQFTDPGERALPELQLIGTAQTFGDFWGQMLGYFWSVLGGDSGIADAQFAGGTSSRPSSPRSCDGSNTLAAVRDEPRVDYFSL